MKQIIFRPEIRDGLYRAAVVLAAKRSNEIHTITPTQLFNDLLFEEWEREYPGMMFPAVDGDIIQIECIPSPLKP